MCVHWRLGYAKLHSKRFAPPTVLTQARSYAATMQQEQTQRMSDTPHQATADTCTELHTAPMVDALTDAAMNVLLPQASAAHAKSGDTVTRIAISAVGFTAQSASCGSSHTPSVATFFSPSNGSAAAVGIASVNCRIQQPRSASTSRDEVSLLATSAGGTSAIADQQFLPQAAVENMHRAQQERKPELVLAARTGSFSPRHGATCPWPGSVPTILHDDDHRQSSGPSPREGVGDTDTNSIEKQRHVNDGNDTRMMSLRAQRAYLEGIDTEVLSQLPQEVQQEMRQAIRGGSKKRQRIDDFFAAVRR